MRANTIARYLLASLLWGAWSIAWASHNVYFNEIAGLYTPSSVAKAACEGANPGGYDGTYYYDPSQGTCYDGWISSAPWCDDGNGGNWKYTKYYSGWGWHNYYYSYLYRWCGSGCPSGTFDDGSGKCIEGPSLADLQEEKGLGASCTTNAATGRKGNPCDGATGNKYQSEVDYAGADDAPGFSRHYNSELGEDLGLGVGWTASFGKRLELYGTTVQIRQRTGRGEPFTCPATTGACTGDPDTELLLSKDGSGYTLVYPEGRTERYDVTGLLVSETDPQGRATTYGYTGGKLTAVTGPFGHSLTLSWNGDHLVSITGPAAEVYAYTYDASDNLTRVDYPDGSAKLYHYENVSFPNYLTGISYEEPAGTVTRYATYAYDVNGKAILTEHAGGMEAYSLTYNTDTQTTATDAIGTAEVMTFAANLGLKNLVSRVNQADGKSLVQSFDANNNLTCKKDEEGRVTTYTYDGTNQKLSMTEGLTGDCANPIPGPETRTISYQYLSPTLDLPTVISAPSVLAGQTRNTSLTYGDPNHPYLPTVITQGGYTPSGTLISRSVALAYNGSGQVISIDGPRTDVSDVTTLAYYQCTTGGACGQLQSVANALGQATTYDTYDAAGRVTQTTGPNGLVTSYTYDARGRVITSVQTPPGGSSRTTGYTYNAAGNVTSVTFPDGASLTYTYSAAQKLTRVTDNLGNYIEYSYDLKGNRTGESTYDPGGTLVRDLSTAYDLRNHVSSINAGGSLTQTIHDAIGNLVSETDPNNNPPTTHGYDALNRLTQTIDSLGGTASYAYTPTDQLAQITAPNYATTQYTYDDLGNRLEEISPDRGTTSYSYDAAGNLVSKTDARGITVTYVYDALNRLISVDYPGTAEDIAYSYDSGTICSAGVGRLCQVIDASGTTRYGYDAFGNAIEQQKTELGRSYTMHYTYDARDRVLMIVYPDGRTIAYTRDALGRVKSVTATINGANLPIVSGRTYRADGLLLSQTYGNGLNETRTYNLKGELTYQSLGSADTRLYGYDANGNLTSLQSLPQVADYGYDALDRLISDQITSAPASSRSFGYDANGNRTSDNNGIYTYASASNRLTQTPQATITLDAAGNTLSDGQYTYSYNQDGHLASVTSGSNTIGTYTYNHQRQRTRKVTALGTTVYHYDLAGNLIVETTSSGALIRAYVWANGEPIGQISVGATETLIYLHADHLRTPRLATGGSGIVVWSWEGAAFATTLPDEDPDGNGAATTANLRFPGQYFDQETGLHYNWNRYYHPRTGRYLTSDPIGLAGGLNTYAYLFNNPLRWIDPLGLFCTFDFAKHYYTGGGSTVDLGGVGLLGAFQNSASVQGSVDSFKRKVASTAKAKARSLCKNCDKGTKSTSFNLNDKDVTNVTGEPCLFAVGYSTFFRNAGCGVTANCVNRAFSFGCSLGFSISDWFEDPIDIGIELLFGTPYRINADWSESYSGSGSF